MRSVDDNKANLSNSQSSATLFLNEQREQKGEQQNEEERKTRQLQTDVSELSLFLNYLFFLLIEIFFLF